MTAFAITLIQNRPTIMKILFSFTLLFSMFIGASGQTATATPSVTVVDEGQKMSVEVVRLFNAGKYEEALPIAKNAVAVREKNFGRDNVLVAQAWRNLAYVQLKLKKPKEAEQAFDKALANYEKIQTLAKPDNESYAEMLEAAAYFDISDGTLSKSISRLNRAIALREQINGVDAVETAGPLKVLGQIYNGIGQYEKAVPLLTRALDIQAKQGSTGENDRVITRSTAVCSLTKLGKTDEAAELTRKYKFSADTTATNPGNRTVNGGVVNGRALSLPAPPYPAEAKSARASGTVSVQVLIDETGKVIFACAVSGAKVLQSATEATAYQSKFSPTTLEGKPVKVSGIITYNFRL